MNSIIKKIIAVVLFAPAIYLAVIWEKLPASVGVHFNLGGKADRFGSKNEIIASTCILIVAALLVYFLLPLVYKIDPKKTAADNKPRLEKIAFYVAVFITFINIMIIDGSAHGEIRLNIKIIFAAIGLMWCVLGNYMYNVKPNYFAGIRLPWTLNNEENWKKTHLLAGKLWFVGGLFIFITCLLVDRTLVIIIFGSVAVITTLVPCIYSYLLYRKQKIIQIKN